MHHDDPCEDDLISSSAVFIASFPSVPVGGGGLVQSLQRRRVTVRDAGAGARHPPPPEPVRTGYPGVHRGTAATPPQKPDAVNSLPLRGVCGLYSCRMNYLWVRRWKLCSLRFILTLAVTSSACWSTLLSRSAVWECSHTSWLMSGALSLGGPL